ncbi:MAG: hypothetical protein R3E83_07860 [Burkholderiaceae bacterium]
MPQVIVVPFTTLGEPELIGRIGETVVDEIITNLSRFPELAVIAGRSSQRHDEDGAPSATRHGNRYRLAGRIRHEPDRLRIIVICSMRIATASSGRKPMICR